MRIPDPVNDLPWRIVLHARFARAVGPLAAEPWAAEIVAAAAHYLAERAGDAPVRDEQLDALLGAALCALGRSECVPPLIAGSPWNEQWAAVVGADASPVLRDVALRRWAKPAASDALGRATWILDARRIFRDEPSGLEIVRFRLLAAALDAIAAAVRPETGLETLAIRPPDNGSRDEIRAFCRTRLAGLAACRAWPRAPDVVWAELSDGSNRR